jgi:hypothetical protein
MGYFGFFFTKFFLDVVVVVVFPPYHCTKKLQTSIGAMHRVDP